LVKDLVRWKTVPAKRLLERSASARSMSEAIAHLASSFLEGIASPPTDLNALATKFNVVSIKGEVMPISGELRRAAQGFEIVYSTDLPPSRRRFTVAHEIAHAYFEYTDGRCRNTKELERLCDMLATEVLMPTDSFRRHKPSSLSPEYIFDLSNKFGVSLRAAALRCHELLDASVFEVVDNEVTWGCGLVRQGPITRIYNEDIRTIIKHATQGNSGERLLFLEKDGVPRRYIISFAPLSKHQRRALLLIKKATAA
jgi:hypothetical protein